MTQEITIRVPAVPVPQPRQRHAVHGGFVRNYTPREHPVQAFKATVRLATQQAGIKVIDGPVALEVDFYLPRPARLMRKKDPWGAIPHTAKPDKDNLMKALQDALSGLAWRDDGQIQALIARKWYTEKDGQPRVEIVIRPATPEVPGGDGQAEVA